jgi:hypothetical protein
MEKVMEERRNAGVFELRPHMRLFRIPGWLRMATLLTIAVAFLVSGKYTCDWVMSEWQRVKQAQIERWIEEDLQRREVTVSGRDVKLTEVQSKDLVHVAERLALQHEACRRDIEELKNYISAF